MKLDTVFRLASASKLLTTIAVLQAVDEGLLKMEEDVSQYIPTLAQQDIIAGFTWYGKPIMKPRSKPITLRGLLTQTVGAGYDFLPIQPLWRYQWWNRRPIAQGDRVEERFRYPLLHQPGEGWTYGSGISWAGRVLEKASGTTLENWMKKHICQPLGLTSVTFFPEADPRVSSRLAELAKRSAWTGKVQYIPRHMQPGFEAECMGGEGICASLEDLLSVLSSLLMDDERLLKRCTTSLMFTPQLTDVQRKPMQECLQLPQWICKHLLRPDEYDWGLGGVLIDGDSHQCLRKGTLLWSGLYHILWVMSRVLGNQVIVVNSI